MAKPYLYHFWQNIIPVMAIVQLKKQKNACQINTKLSMRIYPYSVMCEDV